MFTLHKVYSYKSNLYSFGDLSDDFSFYILRYVDCWLARSAHGYRSTSIHELIIIIKMIKNRVSSFYEHLKWVFDQQDLTEADSESWKRRGVDLKKRTKYVSMHHTSKLCVSNSDILEINPFKPEFTIVIFIHYKPRIAVAIRQIKEDNCYYYQFHENVWSKNP